MHGYSPNSQMEFKTAKLKSNLCAMQLYNKQMKKKEKVIFRNCVPFNECVRKINIREVDNAKGLDVVMAIKNLQKR